MEKEVLKKLFPEEMKRRENGQCPLCGIVVSLDEFHDELSKKEFKISGLCQKCQDGIFY